MSAHPLLIELFTEELPPKALAKLSAAFSEGIAAGLQNAGLTQSNGQIESFATPRRLSVRIAGVIDQGTDKLVELKGPSTKVGLDANGKPTQALIKWAEKQGTTPEHLTQASDGKQDCFFFKSTVKGQTLTASISGIINDALVKLPIPKLMQYQLLDGSSVSFVRPAHGLIVLWGDKVIPASVLGLQSGNTTNGHRFQGDTNIAIGNATSYESQLEERGHVIASLTERRNIIKTALASAAQKLGASLGDSPAVEPLIDEVNALVEWPAIYVGTFEDAFLEVPQECLILSMRTNQKYFPLFDAKGTLLSKFLIVSNMDIADPSAIIDGNERVVRPRLADARFFFEQDKKTSLADRIPALANVVYHAKLGTQAARSLRVAHIAEHLTAAVNQLPKGTSSAIASIDVSIARRAALLAKTDLLTDMVGEFPELQGLMGTYYARHDGESEAIAVALNEQYQPRFAGDALPQSPIGTVIALADKLETLCGMFGIGALPTGDRDPFALRRHALGVIRMLIENKLDLPLGGLIKIGYSAFTEVAGFNMGSANELQSFFNDRLSGYLRDKGAQAKEVAAVMALTPDTLTSIPARLEAVKTFTQLPAAESLSAANKRIANLLKKSVGTAATPTNTALLSEGAEQKLFELTMQLAPKVSAAIANGDYTSALQFVATAKDTVDNFFAAVMVMDENPDVRANRLSLLATVHSLMNQVADISLLA